MPRNPSPAQGKSDDSVGTAPATVNHPKVRKYTPHWRILPHVCHLHELSTDARALLAQLLWSASPEGKTDKLGRPGEGMCYRALWSDRGGSSLARDAGLSERAVRAASRELELATLGASADALGRSRVVVRRRLCREGELLPRWREDYDPGRAHQPFSILYTNVQVVRERLGLAGTSSARRDQVDPRAGIKGGGLTPRNPTRDLHSHDLVKNAVVNLNQDQDQIITARGQEPGAAFPTHPTHESAAKNPIPHVAHHPSVRNTVPRVATLVESWWRHVGAPRLRRESSDEVPRDLREQVARAIHQALENGWAPDAIELAIVARANPKVGGKAYARCEESGWWQATMFRGPLRYLVEAGASYLAGQEPCECTHAIAIHDDAGCHRCGCTTARPARRTDPLSPPTPPLPVETKALEA